MFEGNVSCLLRFIWSIERSPACLSGREIPSPLRVGVFEVYLSEAPVYLSTKADSGFIRSEGINHNAEGEINKALAQ